jgi:hypothetical protein
MPRPYFIKSGAYVSQFGGAHLRKAFGIPLFELAPDNRTLVTIEKALYDVQKALTRRQLF